MTSINLTIHNQEKLLPRVLDGIFNNIVSDFEIICVIDGCTDNSEDVLFRYLGKQKNKNLKGFNVLFADDVFETRANNMAAKASKGEYIIIVQDDCVINTYSFDKILTEPFRKWNDVFAVSGNCAHSWKYNPEHKGIDSNGWSNLLQHHSHANKTNTPKGIFAVRDSVNRGPLVINREDIVKLNYFDEIYAPLDMDEHDLIMRMKKEMNKVVGYVNIDWEAGQGGTRNEDGSTKQWALDAQQKNVQIFYERHKDEINKNVIENRTLC